MTRTKKFLLAALMAAGAARAEVQLSGELRLRPEYFNNADFNKKTKDTQSFTGSRLRITGSGLAAEDIALKFTLQDTRLWGAEFNANTVPAANAPIGLTDSGEMVDVHEAFVDFQSFLKLPVSFRAGRQELSYGDQRLVGAFGWNNQGRAFDAFKLSYVGNALSVDAWTAKRRDANAAAAGDSSADRDFSGAYATLKPLFPGAAVDVYFLHDREGDVPARAKPTNIFTYGARLFGKNGGLDYTIEVPLQSGHVGRLVGATTDTFHVSALAYAAKAGWTFPGNAELRIGAELDYASGDKDPADKKAQTFNNLYPTNHPFYGFMDYQGWRNMKGWNVAASLKPSRRTFFLAQYWDFSLAQAKDGWYPASGVIPAGNALRGASAANTDKHVGREVDLLARFAQSRLVVWEAGYSRFLPSALIKSRAANVKFSDWAYVMSTVKF